MKFLIQLPNLNLSRILDTKSLNHSPKDKEKPICETQIFEAFGYHFIKSNTSLNQSSRSPLNLWPRQTLSRHVHGRWHQSALCMCVPDLTHRTSDSALNLFERTEAALTRSVGGWEHQHKIGEFINLIKYWWLAEVLSQLANSRTVVGCVSSRLWISFNWETCLEKSVTQVESPILVYH